MAYATATDPDRLPWLGTEQRPQASRGRSSLAAWSALALLVVGGGSYWYGMSGPAPGEERPEADASAAVGHTDTSTLPPPAPTSGGAPQTLPGIEPAPPQPIGSSDSPSAAAGGRPIADAPAPDAVETGTRRYWPSDRSAGAAGRMIRVGSFGSTYEAKRGWVRIARAYPALRHMPAVVVSDRSASGGAVRYRLQIGTSSRAQSSALCSDLRIIGRSCAIVGSPVNAGERG